MKKDTQIINDLRLEIEILKLELARKEEQKQYCFRVCEGLMENEKFYQKEFERLRNELQQAKLGNP